MNATINLENKHFPVLLKELISIISPLYGGTFLDCTFGQGGYSKKILEKKNNKVIAIDRDKEVYLYAKELEQKHLNRFHFQNAKFSNINNIKINSKDLKAIIFDLGYSTNQIKNMSRGFSFKSTGKLDMTMGINDFSCHEVIKSMSEDNLYKIFKYYGDEKYAKKIARKIVEIRKTKIIHTEDLTKLVDSIKRYKNYKINNSTKIFQALRIYVNKEISELINGLINAFKLIPIGGIIAVITFHSIEDKIVKFFFKNYSEIKNSSRYSPIRESNSRCLSLKKKKPITPSEEELKQNPRSRSAKLRFAVKVNNEVNFEEFIQKFKHLTDIEELQFNK